MMLRRLLARLALAALLAWPGIALAQRQVPDLDHGFENNVPAYAPGTGPQILVSAQNSKFVQLGNMAPFARLAQADGFRVDLRDGTIEGAIAAAPGIIVIANPYMDNYRDFPAMTPPSAFTAQEIGAIRQWVEDGGSLLLLADHAPFGGGSSDLARAFGFEFLNGHTANTVAADAGDRRVVIAFTPDAGLNPAHPITSGATGRAKVTRFQAFGGQSFIAPPGADMLLSVPQGWSAIFTYRLEEEIGTAPRIDASGMAQGAAMDYGKGRIAVFAETGGFTAQIIDGTRRFGFNTPEGAANPEFILATLRWLARFEPK